MYLFLVTRINLETQKFEIFLATVKKKKSKFSKVRGENQGRESGESSGEGRGKYSLAND